LGIRSTKELEEVIEGYSFANEFFLEEIGYTIIPSVEEIIVDFCKYC
jgi:hypothetical protein